jgi:DNA-directed RNA polymerase specialized sigma24 family protein
VEVSEAVYRAYHKEREAERYQKKLIHQFELSLERFQDEGVNVEFLITRFQPTIENMLIEQEQFWKLHIALDALTVEERLLIHELFFNGKSERILSGELGVPRMTLSDRKHCILRKMKKVLED